MGMTSKNKEKLLCVFLFIAGVAMCGGGFVIPALAVVGAAVLASAIGVLVNIMQNKEKITVNNNYTNYIPADIEPMHTRSKDAPDKPSNKLKSFFGFKNKKFMKHHEELLKPEIEENESAAMQLPPDIINEITKLNEMLQKIDIDAISKGAQQYEQIAHDSDTPKD